MKKKSVKDFNKSLMALILALIFIIPNNIGVFASSNEDFFDFEKFHFLIPAETNEYEALIKILEVLSPEAMEIFLEYLSYGASALATFQLHVDPNFQIRESHLRAGVVPTANNLILSELSARLIAIGLSSARVSTFLAIASSILSTPGTITVAIIVTALTAHAVHSIIVGDWHNISSSWTQIGNAFAASFSSLVSSSTMNSAFNTANTSYENDFIRRVTSDLGSIASGFDPLDMQCDIAANRMASYLIQRNQRGDQITLTFPNSINGLVVSNSFRDGNVAIGNNSMHTGVSFRQIVFCPVHSSGATESFWIRDFESAGQRFGNVHRRPIF